MDWQISVMEPRMALMKFPELGQKMVEVFGIDANGMSRWSLDKALARVMRSDFVGVVLANGQELIGYSLVQCRPLKARHEHLLWVDSTGIIERARGNGIAGELRRAMLASARRGDRTVSWICAKTQNPVIMRHYIDSGFCLPFHDSYDSVPGRLLLDALESELPPVMSSLSSRTSGIFVGAYGASITDSCPQFAGLPELVRHFVVREGFNCRRGDAVLLCARIRDNAA